MPAAIIVGAGPGIGRSVALRFAREGLVVSVIARRQASVDAIVGDIESTGGRADGYCADSSDAIGLRAALDASMADHGVPDVLVYNAANVRRDGLTELSVHEHERAWSVNVIGALTAATHVASQMSSGTILLTGGMPSPDPQFVSLSLGKAGVRALAHILDLEYGPAGIHVATVTVAGEVAPGTPFDPDAIAERYWALHRQPRGRWDREVEFDGC